MTLKTTSHDMKVVRNSFLLKKHVQTMYLLTRYDRKRISELFEKNEYFEKKIVVLRPKKFI